MVGMTRMCRMIRMARTGTRLSVAVGDGHILVPMIVVLAPVGCVLTGFLHCFPLRPSIADVPALPVSDISGPCSFQ
jgi:hypothetical protein